ncbi:MAG: hypothetical protein JO250_09125, partial [Armatimonadetes bacterium]|nr:hypothetical protein [Armatimonadota bacterium]
MAFSPFAKTWGTFKPPPGCRLDRAHELSAQLSDCLLLNEAGGTKLVNLAGADGSLSAGSGTAGWGTTRLGPGAVIGGGGSLSLPRLGNYAGQDATIRIVHAPSSWAAYTSLPDLANYSVGQGGREFSLFFDTNGNINYIGFGGNTPPLSGGGANTSMSAGGVYDFVFTRSPSSGVGTSYVNGKLMGTINAGNATTQTTTAAAIGTGDSGGGSNYNGAIVLFQGWIGRALNAAEVASLYAQPYQMLLPAASRYYSIPSPAAGRRFPPVGAGVLGAGPGIVLGGRAWTH